MARKPNLDPSLIDKAQEISKDTKCAATLRLCQSILLPARLDATLEETAKLLSVSRASVPRMQQRFRNQFAGPNPPPPRNWGGRRRQLMTPEEEDSFLKPWLEQASRGEIVVASPIRAALSQRLQKKIAASVVYKLLARHGWRKVAPDTRHPKSDPEVQEAWKKNSRKNWLPSSNPMPSMAAK
jgi:transposase